MNRQRRQRRIDRLFREALFDHYCWDYIARDEILTLICETEIVETTTNTDIEKDLTWQRNTRQESLKKI